MPDPRGSLIHISSAVVRCLPASVGAVRHRIEALEAAGAAVEIVHAEDNKLLLIIEGTSTGAVGGCLAQIAAFEDVVSAAMVYEQVETRESLGEEA